MNGRDSSSGRSIRRTCRFARTLWLVLLLVQAAGAAPAAPVEPSLPPPDDNMVFREALRCRGLSSWIEQYWADQPATDEVAASLRRRERLLTEAAAEGVAPARTAELVSQASTLLADLIAAHLDHPDQLRWRLELARDYLERQAPQAFVSVLTYELPGRDTDVVRDLSRRAMDVLDGLRQEIAKSWKSVEALSEASLAIVRDTGSLDALEAMDAQSSTLLTWARLYQAISADLGDQQRRAAFAQVLTDLHESGRLEPVPGREFDQAGAALIAAIAERRLSVLDQQNAAGFAMGAGIGEPDRRAREVIAIQSRITDAELRRRLRQASLIAVLEQIRAVRDARRYDDALQFATQAREWTLKSRPDEPSAFIALSLLEATTLWFKQAAEQSGAVRLPDPRTSVAWLDCEPCLKVLERACLQSPAHRDALYDVLATAVVPWPPSESARPFVLQLAVGAGTHAARSNPSVASGLSEQIPAIQAALESGAVAAASAQAGELRYLLGQSLHWVGRDVEAVQVLTDLVAGAATHDRADAAIREAVAWAGNQVRAAGPTGSPESRTAFIRAARAMQKRTSGGTGQPSLSYALAAVLENDRQFREAALEYAAVPPTDGRAGDAALGQLRCWRLALSSAGTSSQPSDVGELAAPARHALDAVLARYPNLKPSAASSAPQPGQPAANSPGCEEAKLLMAATQLLNVPAIGGAGEAVEMLEGFEGRTRACPELLGPALRERILALRQLKRLSEARAVLDDYLAAEPDHAGTAMAGLLQSMHEEILALLERGADDEARVVAAEAAEVAESLLAWAAADPGRLNPPDRVVIRIWYTDALLQAGKTAEAFEASQQLAGAGLSDLPSDAPARTRADLVRADALLASGRKAEAVALYSEVWQNSSEHSDAWWHAFVGSLECHVSLGTEPGVILQSIRQQRTLAPDLGGGRWSRRLVRLEAMLQAAQATRPN